MSLSSGTVLDLEGGPLAADLIRDALLGKLGADETELATHLKVDPRGLQITNADVQGPLDLSDAVVSVAVCITRSRLPQGINLNGARLSRRLSLRDSTVGTINLSGTHITGSMLLTGTSLTDSTAKGISLAADNLQVEGNAFFDRGFESLGAIDLSGARIAGALRMTGAQLTGSNQEGMSFTGGNLQVGGSAFLDDGFRSSGTVLLLGARIAGRLRLCGAQLADRSQNGMSLAGDYLQVGGNALLNENFTANGAVYLPGARITGSLLLTSAKIGDRNGISLAGDNLQVGADTFLNEGFTTTGAVHLPGARIAGTLVMSGAQLTGTNQRGSSLAGNNLQVDGNALLDEGFTTAGAIFLLGARITGVLRMTDARVGTNQDRISLAGDNLQVGADTFLSEGFTSAGAVHLYRARIAGTLFMSGAQLTGINQHGSSLAGNNLQVGADTLLDEGFTTAGAVHLYRARITGVLRMTDARVGTNQDRISLVGDNLQVGADTLLNEGFTTTGAVHLYGARIAGTLFMSGAQITGTNQRGSSLAGNNLQVDGNALLDEGFTTAGAIFLLGARITGVLRMTDARVGTNQDRISLVGDNLQVGADTLLNEGFTTAGAVHLPGARIAGMLVMSGAQLTGTNQRGSSLAGNNLQVDGNALLDEGFTTAGAIFLLGARITGVLRMTDARVGTNQDRISLVGDNLQVGADTFLDEGFTTAGAIFLPGANLTRALVMSGAQLTGTNEHGDSLIGDNLQVGADAFLDEGFTTAGAIRLHGTRITGRLAATATAVRPGTLDSPGLDLTGAIVDDLQLNLADVGWLDRPKLKPDRSSPSPSRVVLSLENCAYKHRPEPALGGLETWLRMLRFHTPEYQPRSYQQLAAVHRATGHDRDAGRILMAQQDHRRATALRPQPDAKPLHRVGLWTTRAGLAIWKTTLGYGYRPRRAIAWLLVLLATAGLLVTIAAHWQADPNTPDVPVAYRPANNDTGTPLGYCSAGEAAGLAVRIAIPLVTNLGQGACVINTASLPGSVIVAASIALQTFAWILGGLTIAAAATAIKRSP